jgi:hypothetical protein
MSGKDVERVCRECDGSMVLEYEGRFSTVYVCRQCRSRLTIPPKQPATRASPDPGGQRSEPASRPDDPERT